MPKKGSKVPSYCRHKASGRAVVRIDGVDIYLGPYGSEESHSRYQAAITEWRNRTETVASKCSSMAQRQRPFILTINDLVARYAAFAAGYYCNDGKPTKELRCMQDALRPMRKLYGDLPATEFGPLKLKAVRQAMIDRGWCRQLVNRQVNRIKRFFKWAVSEELIPSSVFESVRTVDGLHAGRSNVREAPPVVPVALEVLNATIPFMSPQVAAMVWLQRLTGMRPGEAVQMRPCDLDCSDEVWVYEPVQHKTRWRGHRKQILLGPKAQSFIQPFLNRADQEHLFQPIEAEAWRSERRRKARKSPLTPSQSARKPKTNRLRPAKDHYTEEAYRRAVDYAIKRANRNGVVVPHWFPNQIRHTYGTEVRKKFGIEAAQVALGHARCDVTEVYAERNLDQAREIARTEG